MKHLDDRQMAAVLAGETPEAAALEHLAACVACRAEADRLRRLIAARRDQLTVSQPDWDGLAAAVESRLGSAGPAERRRRPTVRVALAAAAMVVLGLAATLIERPHSVVPGRGELAVEEVLAEAEALLASDSIPGFEVIDPAAGGLDELIANGAS